MAYFFVWLGLSFLLGMAGKSRSIGFWGAFFASLVFSPLVGLIFVLLSKQENLTAGEQLLKLGKVDKALQIFHDVLKEQPYSATAQYNLACAYSRKNMPQEALFHLNKALENGYSNLDNLRNNPDLSNLRSYESYQSFEQNNYAFICFKVGQGLV